MPHYKKKKHNRIFSQPARPARKPTKDNAAKQTNDIPMTSKHSKGLDKEMKVVRGKAIHRKERFKLLSIIALALAFIIIAVNFIAPAGIISFAKNSLALMGSGGYPIDSQGGDTLNTLSMGSYFYVLTGTEISAYANSGKQLFSFSHGFDTPILKASSSRALVFNQGKTEAILFDLNGPIKEITTEKNILNAAVSNSGSYAIATHSDKYACAVTVYNKNHTQVYEWYSAEDTVNALALSSNGKKLAVATLSALGGSFTSSIKVLGFKSADPLFSQTYANTPIYNIDSTHAKCFAVVMPNEIQFIGWSKYKINSFKNEYNITFLRATSGGFAAVFNRESDKNDNRIAVFSKDGKLQSQLNFNGIISDIRLFGGHIYCMNDNEVLQLNSEGEIIRRGNCSFGAVHLSVISTNTVAVISDGKIEKLLLEQEQEK